MNAASKVEAGHPLALLRAEFPPHQISKLPKPTKKQTDEVRADFKKGVRCQICGAWHHPDVVHLDYVGHAALTDRLLDTDMEWSWEPVAFTAEGTPAFDKNGGLWIKLTVCGVTRFGYGSADGKSGGDAVKEIIGDALRNAAMRFGAALDLWHKGDLHADEPDEAATINDDQIAVLQGYASGGVIDAAKFCAFFEIGNLKMLPASRFDEAVGMAKSKVAKAKAEPVKELAPAGDVLDDEIPY